MSAIPAIPEEITADWLTEVLGANPGDITEVKCRAAEAESGFVSLICFLELSTRPGSDVPEKLVAKLAPTFEGSREVATAFRLFAREQQFYERIAPRIAVRSPRALHCDAGSDSGLGILLLEDCSHMRAFDQTLDQPTTLEELETLIDAAARLALSSWDAPWLSTESEVLHVEHPVAKAYFGGLQAGFPALLESEYMAEMPDGFRPVAERLCTDFQALVEAQPAGNRSLCHMDFRLANVFFDDASSDPVVLYDWQSMYPGRLAQDLGYLLGSGYSPEFRREHEETMLRRYHGKLLEAGVTGYTFDEVWMDYQHGIMIGLRLLPMALGDLDLSSEGGAAIFRKIFHVLPQAALDHGGVDLIDQILSRPL